MLPASIAVDLSVRYLDEGDGVGILHASQPLGLFEHEGDRLAGPVYYLRAGGDWLNARLLGIGGDVLPAASAIALLSKSQALQKDCSSEFGHDLASPVPASLYQVAVLVIGGMD